MPLTLVLLGQSIGKEKLNIYNWSYYIPDSIIDKFEKEYNVKVIYDEFESNEEMYTRLKTGNNSFDIVFPSQDYASIMINQGMFGKIDKSLIHNLKNIDPLVLEKTIYDPAMEFSVPFYWGATGVIVNTDKVPDYEESWSIFGRSNLKGRMSMLDDMREVIGASLIYSGYSPNSKNPTEIEAAMNLINNQWKPNLLKFDSEEFGKNYAIGELWVVHGYAETVFEEILDNEQLLKSTIFFIPSEGGIGYVDSICILKSARNVHLAHKFIDFIHRPEIYAEFCDNFRYPSAVNIPARKYIERPAWYQAGDIINTNLTYNLDNSLELYHNVWFNSIRTGN